ncbi:hypothetical protein KVR01_012908 [Diaporthe batatas]|uniref:uncharacterized protein n=1 Tax=Diaporthe batatas TaxID=748121 RepID=UPI001D03AF0E|nr:uncharacterized protein KVR01_012908 [Diaporthe batatas]KAG8157200.1 hypothetical protein KVR01_012908 [Diaporthe batatas]
MESETPLAPTRALTRGRGLTSVMLERKLVTLRQVTAIRKPCGLCIKGLEIATVTGDLEVIVRKAKFKVGQWVLYFEVDSFIPSSALKATWTMRHILTTFDGEKGYHVKTRVVGKHTSQGHLMAIEDHSLVLRIVNIMREEYGPQEGLRVASMMAFEDAMGVKKWEPEDDSDTPTPSSPGR